MSNEAEKKQYLLNKLGGRKQLRLAVNSFYDHLVAYPEFRPFFEGVDMVRLKAHQYNFFSFAFVPGMEDDAQRLITMKHKRLFDMGLSAKHFDIMISEFVQTLNEVGLDQVYIKEAVDQLKLLRPLFEKGEAASMKQNES